MKLFNNKKKQQSKQASLLANDGGGGDNTATSPRPGLAAATATNDATTDVNGRDGGDGVLLMSSSSTAGSGSIGQSMISMDWDKIYVEIDNDANGTIGHAPTASSSMLGSKETFESKSYTIMEDESNDRTCDEDDGDMTNVTPWLDKVNSGTMTAGSRGGGAIRTLVTNATSRESSEGECDEDGTLMAHTCTMDEEEEDARERTADDYSITKDGKYLSNNHFANAQLMRWKHAAEEGPSFIQVLAFLSAIASLTSTLYPLVTDDEYWTIPTGICAFHTTILCILIIVFEVRAWGARNPMSLRARIRNLLVRYLNVLRLVWGRGFLYIFAGTMNITIFFAPYVYYTGCTLIGLGLLAILIGAHASFNLERLRLSLTDHSFLWSKFVEADTDKDNLIGISEFSNLVWSLGLELDDAYTYRAFSEIDQDADSKISFHEFKSWWIASQDGDETILSRDLTKPLVVSNTKRNTKIPNHISV